MEYLLKRLNSSRGFYRHVNASQSGRINQAITDIRPNLNKEQTGNSIIHREDQIVFG